MCVWEIFEGSAHMDIMDEISEEVGCDLRSAGDTFPGNPEDMDEMDREYYANIKTIEETRAILDNGKFTEVFESYRKLRATLWCDGGKVACFMLAIRSMKVGATIRDDHKRYLRRHSKRVLGPEGHEHMKDALKRYQSGEPWNWPDGSDSYPEYGVTEVNKEKIQPGDTSEDQDTVDTTAAESQEKRKASAEHVKAADEDVPKTKKRKTSNCKD